MPSLEDRVSVVVVTRNRVDALRRTLSQLGHLPEPPAVVVVDDASSDGTATVVRREFPAVDLVVRPEREGPVARNHGVERSRTPYVALSDDDSWWAPTALERAADVLDSQPHVAVVAAHILVGDERRDDPMCEEMARSPVGGRPGMAGVPVLSFMAGASVIRRTAFDAIGGFEPRLGGGGEEETLACDLAAAGWELRYVPEVVAHHHPGGGDKSLDKVLGIRNSLWFAWRRRPLPSALRWTMYMVRAAPHRRSSVVAFAGAVKALPWVMKTRRVVPRRVEAGLRVLDREKMTSKARRYG